MNLLNLIVTNQSELTHFIGEAQREGQALMQMKVTYAYKNLTTGELLILDFEQIPSIENLSEPCIPTQS